MGREIFYAKGKNRIEVKSLNIKQQTSKTPRAQQFYICNPPRLASATLRHHAPLYSALVQCGLLMPSPHMGLQGTDEGTQIGLGQLGVVLVMAHDLLLGHGLKGDGPLQRRLETRQADLQAAFEKQQSKVAEGQE